MSYRSDVDRVRQLYSTKKGPVERGQSWVMFTVLRPLSFWMTPPFLRASMSANQVTALGWPLVALTAILLATGRRSMVAAAGLLFLLIFLLDLVDGNIARFRDTRTHFGKFLDGTSDSVKYPVLYLALALGIGHDLERLALGRWAAEQLSSDAWLVIAAGVGILRLLDAQMNARIEQGICTIALQRAAAGQIDVSAGLTAGRTAPARGLSALPRRFRRVESELEVPAWVGLTAIGRTDVLLLWAVVVGTAVVGLQILRHLMRARAELSYPRP